MNSLIVIDDFLQDPDSVRKLALSQTYFGNQKEDSTFPGKRTKVIAEILPEYNFFVFNKLTALLFNLEQSSYSVDIASNFQLVSGKFMRGWVHSDSQCGYGTSDPDIAGILYLNPAPPINSGTEFYRLKEGVQIKDFSKIKKQFVMEKAEKEEAVYALQENNNQYELTDFISNKYNRLILYPAQWLHCAGNYFGSTDEDSRLTQVFFIKCVGHNSDVKYFIDKVRMT